jgi:hypothetical protein
VTKHELLAALDNVLNNIVYGLLLTRLVPLEAWKAVSSPVASFKGPNGNFLRLDVSRMRDRMENPEYKKAITEEFENCLKRATVSEGHELILLYCEQTNQFQIYKSQPWFQFARIARNIVSHKSAGVLRQWPNDLKNSGVTSVSWHHRTLNATMVGTEIPFTLFEALQLLKDQIDFVRTEIT